MLTVVNMTLLGKSEHIPTNARNNKRLKTYLLESEKSESTRHSSSNWKIGWEKPESVGRKMIRPLMTASS